MLADATAADFKGVFQPRLFALQLTEDQLAFDGNDAEIREAALAFLGDNDQTPLGRAVGDGTDFLHFIFFGGENIFQPGAGLLRCVVGLEKLPAQFKCGLVLRGQIADGVSVHGGDYGITIRTNLAFGVAVGIVKSLRGVSVGKLLRIHDGADGVFGGRIAGIRKCRDLDTGNSAYAHVGQRRAACSARSKCVLHFLIPGCGVVGGVYTLILFNEVRGVEP